MSRLLDIRVASWAELHERLYEGSWKRALGRFRSDLAFRGVSDAGFDLQTSLMRLGGDFRALEGHLLRNFRKYARRDAVLDDSVWNWLAVAQHHGMPTRLLDWTFSPYVAMHFATAGSMDRDGAIWCVNFVRTNEALPRKLRDLLKEEGSNVFTVQMLERGAATLQRFERLSPRDFVAFFEPPSLDERIVNQYALFSVMSKPQARLDEFLSDSRRLYRRIIVPAALKWEVRDKLDQANVNERVLFPGLDGLSAWLRRHYLPRDKTHPPRTAPAVQGQLPPAADAAAEGAATTRRAAGPPGARATRRPRPRR